MKKYIFILSFVPFLLPALPLANASAEDIAGTDENISITDENSDHENLVSDVVDSQSLGSDNVAAKVTTLTLAWLPNPEPDVAGYNLYYGKVSGSYVKLTTVTIPTATIVIKGTKTTYFVVTAFDTSGAESPFSAEVHFP